MSEERATRGRTADEPRWQALLDPAELEARLADARARRDAALARRAAGQSGDAAPSRTRADRLRALDLALADPVAPPADAARPVPERPAPVRAAPAPPIPADPPRTEARAAPTPPPKPLSDARRSISGAPPVQPLPVRPLPAPAVSPPRAAEPRVAMPERLAAVIPRPEGPRPAEKPLATPAAARPRRGPLSWSALAIGLLVGGAGAFAAAQWISTRAPSVPAETAALPPPAEPAAPPAPAPSRPLRVTGAGPMPAETAPPRALPALPAGPTGVEEPVVADLAPAPAPRPLASIEEATAAAASLAATPGLLRQSQSLRFADAATAAAGLPVARAPFLMLPDALPAAENSVPYAILAEDLAPPAAPAAVRTSTAPAQAPTPTVPAQARTPATAAPRQPAATVVATPQPPAPDPGIHGTLERAVESMLRSRIFGN